MLDWPKVSALPWRHRNAEVQRAIRTFLATRPNSETFATFTLATFLYPCDHEHEPGKKTVAKLAQLMARLAPYMAPFATHDGDQIIRYGRAWRRWQWRGQAPARELDPTCALCEFGEEHEH